ncbi:ABC transporter permease [Halalkalirubrum salinum]|uniref:ABC transporter permease n=1 Tax=Halalkalirubrum salinum TaxID=2563889 RepID=UPI0010FAFD1F|nr:ABC transporter permease [Halalkalirubrum salinum]
MAPTTPERTTERGRIRISGFDPDVVASREPLSSWTPELEATEGKGRLEYAWERFKRNRLALFGTGVIVFMVLLAVFARPIELPDSLPVLAGQVIQPFSLAPVSPGTQDLINAHNPPTLENLAAWPPSPLGIFGTDWAGRDLFSRVIYGGRWSLSIGFIAVAVALFIGIPLGSIAGYYGGKIDEAIMRVVDMLYAFPFIVLAIAVIAILGRGYWELVLALVAVGWLPYARIIRGEILSVKENEYVAAAKALGATDRMIIIRHILPNAMAPVIVQATLSVGTIVLAAAALGFIGLGLSPASAEWGVMLNVEQDSIARGRWWAGVFPGLAIFTFVMAINLLGDGVRDAFDPQGDRTGSGGMR